MIVPTFCDVCGGQLLSGNGLCPRCLLVGAKDSNQSNAEPEALNTPTSLLEKRKFGQFVLEEEIARGGMGAVFKARQLQPERTVALKVIAAGELATPRMVERFQTEAKAAAKLEHPRIVPIYEVGRESGWNYFSMRLIEGKTLADEIGGEPMSAKRSAQLMVQICEAVSHAHANGVLHRDLKPTNILIDRKGEPFLTDFGLAKEAGSELTFSNAVIGTPAYMAPEQAAGRSDEIAEMTDVYGLGVLLYEMLVGHPPFESASVPELLRKIEDEEPSIPLQFRKSTGNFDLEIICLRCLEKEPQSRYKTVDELSADLQRWLNHEPIKARSVSTWGKLQRWVRRRPWAAAFAAVSIASFILLCVISLVFNVFLDQERKRSEENAANTRTALISAHIHEAGNRFAANEGLVGLASLAEARQLANGETPAAADLDERIGLAAKFTPRLLRVWDAGGAVRSLTISEDRSCVVAILADGTNRVWRAETNQQLRNPEPDRQPIGSAVSRDGSTVLEMFDDAPFARIWDLSTNETKNLSNAPNSSGAGAVSSNGRKFMFGGDAIYFYDRDRTELRKFGRVDTVFPPCIWLGFSPDDSRIVSTHNDRSGWFWDVKTGEQLQSVPSAIQVTLELESPSFPRFSADGSRMAWAGKGYLRAGEFGSAKSRFHHFQRKLILGVDISPDGRRLAAAEYGAASASVWNVEKAEQIGDTIHHQAGCNLVRYSPDGRWLATAGFDFRLRIHDAATQSQVWPDLHHHSLVRAVEFSSDGQLMVAGTADGLVRVWDLAISSGQSPESAEVQRKSAFDTESRRLALNRGGGQIGIWDTLEQNYGLSIEAPKVVSHIVLSPDNRLVAACCRQDGFMVWNLETAETVYAVDDFDVSTIAFSPDGQRLAVGNETTGETVIYNLAQPDAAPAAAGNVGKGPNHLVEWSSDGRWIVSSGGSKILVWDVAESKPLVPTIEGIGAVAATRFSPNSRQLAVSWMDKSVHSSAALVVALPSMQTLHKLTHGDGICDVMYSPDGTMIATCGEDNFVRVWRLSDGRQLSQDLHHSHFPLSADFDPQNRTLATISKDGWLRFWDISRGVQKSHPVWLDGYAVGPVRFSPDGNWLLVNRKAEPLILDLRSSDAEIRNAMIRAGLASGLMVSEAGSFYPLSVQDQARRFEAAFAAHPDAFAWPE